MKRIILALLGLLVINSLWADNKKPTPVPTVVSCKLGILVYRERVSGDKKFRIYTFAIRHRNCTDEVLPKEYQFTTKEATRANVREFEKGLLAAYRQEEAIKISPTPTVVPDVTE